MDLFLRKEWGERNYSEACYFLAWTWQCIGWNRGRKKVHRSAKGQSEIKGHTLKLQHLNKDLPIDIFPSSAPGT